MRKVIITVTDPDDTILDRKAVEIKNDKVTELVVIDEEGCANYTCEEHAHLTIGKPKKEAGLNDAAARTKFRSADKMELAKWLHTLYPLPQRADLDAILDHVDDELDVWIHNHYEDDWVMAWDVFAQSLERSHRKDGK